MACSVQYQSTKETTNACRVLHLLFGPCTDQFRDLLAHHFNPGALYIILATNTPFIPAVRILQIKLYRLDITLIYTLLRYLSGLPPHINGWGKDPDSNEFSEAANIERIRLLRNKFSHNQSITLSDADFRNVWINTKRVIQDLYKILANGGKYEKAMVPLEYITMDPKETKFWRKELKRKHKEEISCKKQIKKVKRDQGKMQTTIERIQSSSHIPENIQILHKMTLDNCRKDDERYAETHFCNNLMQVINDNKITVLTGGPGCGKTATSRHVAIKLLELDFTVIPIGHAEDIIKYGHPELKQVFLLDSAFGEICFQDQLHNDFRRNFDFIRQILDPKSKLLITCRKDILIEARQLKIHTSLPQTVFDLEDEKNLLTKEDRLSILTKYVDIENCPAAQEINEYVEENDVQPMFPFLCEKFKTNINYKNKGCSFFKEPYPISLEQLDEIE
ncbi:uncharacterized protein LOC134283238 [Saccostrea cucullata]|uniref:uncharacterized protein LOC134283238 n=1 Tax=Saccostrea cuccullata TaxID=36930 RepID=UPI002ED6940E